MIVKQVGCIHATTLILVIIRVANPIVELQINIALYRKEGRRLSLPQQSDLIGQFALNILSPISIEAAQKYLNIESSLGTYWCH
jgi:hypothetical protein